jgi:xanthine dehydrogenase accessory factor
MGSVSGGCVEGAVVAEGLEALEDGAPRLLTFGVSDDEAFAVGLACGGTIRVLVEPVGAALPEAVLADLVAARAERRAVAALVNLSTWERRLTAGPGDPLADQIAARLLSDKSGVEGDWFIAVHNPPLRMIVVGAVHIAQPLVAMARLPGESIRHDWPDAALADIGLDARTAVITLTHDPKLDDPAISAALASDIFYLGCLGSTRTHAKRVARLQEAGFAEPDIARIHAPVGLDIGAKSPAEIAVSIMAEVTQALRRR